MALSLEGQCDAAQDNEASQHLALALSVVFGVYAFLAIGLNEWRSFLALTRRKPRWYAEGLWCRSNTSFTPFVNRKS